MLLSCCFGGEGIASKPAQSSIVSASSGRRPLISPNGERPRTRAMFENAAMVNGQCRCTGTPGGLCLASRVSEPLVVAVTVLHIGGAPLGFPRLGGAVPGAAVVAPASEPIAQVGAFWIRA